MICNSIATQYTLRVLRAGQTNTISSQKCKTRCVINLKGQVPEYVNMFRRETQAMKLITEIIVDITRSTDSPSCAPFPSSSVHIVSIKSTGLEFKKYDSCFEAASSPIHD